jgi:hypothetical protein
MSRSDDDIAMGAGEHEELFPVYGCESCTCCTAEDCVPSECGEDDYGRFHCPCWAE